MAYDLAILGAVGFLLYQCIGILSIAMAGETNKLAVWSSYWLWLMVLFIAAVIGCIVAVLSVDDVNQQPWTRGWTEYVRSVLLGYAGVPMLKKTSDAAAKGLSFNNTTIEVSDDQNHRRKIRWWWQQQ